MRTAILSICSFSAGVILTLLLATPFAELWWYDLMLLWSPQRTPSADANLPSATVTTSYSAQRVTIANFQSVQLGMSYNEVIALLGPPSRTIYENVGGSLPSSAYAWNGPSQNIWDSSSIQVAFEYGKVVSKHQQGFR